MTATSSRNALPIRNALRVVDQNKKMTIVTCILYLLGMPLMALAAMLELIGDSHIGDTDAVWQIIYGMHMEMYIVIGMTLLGAAVFMGMFAAINSFTEMHKKTKVDMLYALPLTGTQRFFSDYLGGCLMYIVPYLISCILSWGIIFGGAPFIKWAEDDDYHSFGEFLGEFADKICMGMFGLFLLMLLYYTLSVLITVCCGTLFESIYTNILLNCLIPGTVALIIGMVSSKLDFDFEYTWHIVGFMSPIGGLFYLIMLISGELNDGISASAYNFAASQTISHEMLPSYFRWVFVILLLTAAMLAGAWLLYKRRKSEETGKPFVYVLAYYLMLTLGTVAILSIALAEDEFIGAVILISAIAYFIMEVIRKRGFKKFWLSIVTYVATVVLTFGCLALIIQTKCFGRMNYVPAAISVSSVRLDMNSTGTDARNFRYELEYTDRDVISGITKLHQDVVKDRKSGDDRFESAMSAQLNEEMLQERWAQLDYVPSYSTQGMTDPGYPEFEASVPYSRIWDDREYRDYDDNEYIDEQALLDPNSQLPPNIIGNYTNAFPVSITYYTVTGSTIHRSYNLTADEYYELINIIRGTELYAKATADGLYCRMEQEYESYDDKLHKSRIPQSIRFNLTNVGADSRSTETNTHTIYLTGAPEKLLQLKEAYQSDLIHMTAEDFATSGIYGYLSEVPVYTKCSATIALLDDWGMKPFNVPERYAFCDKQNKLGSNFEGVMGIRLYAPADNRTASYNYPHSTASSIYVKGNPAYQDGIYVSEWTDLEKNYPELYKLLDAASSSYVTNEDCYVLFFNNKQYVIPAADTALAEAVIAKGSNYGWKKTHIEAGDLGWSKTTTDQDYYQDVEFEWDESENGSFNFFE